MTGPLRVYINARGVDVPPGATVLDAVRLADPAEGERVAAGARSVTDSRGLPVPATEPVYLGAIFRTVSARSGGSPTTA